MNLSQTKHCLVLYHGHYKSLWYTEFFTHADELRKTLDAAGVDYRYYPPSKESTL